MQARTKSRKWNKRYSHKKLRRALRKSSLTKLGNSYSKYRWGDGMSSNSFNEER